MLLAAAYHSPKKPLTDIIPELLQSFKGLESYAISSLILFLAAIVLGFLILKRGWGIGYRLALIPLALLPFLICLSGSLWEITFHYHGFHADVGSPILHDIADKLILVPFGALQSFLLLILSFLTFIQTGNGQLAYVLPGRSIDPA